MECPQCREDLMCRINKKVSRAVLITVACSIVGVSGYFAVYGMKADARQKEVIAENVKDIAVIEVKINNIEKTVKRIEDKQITKQDIVDAVKKALGK